MVLSTATNCSKGFLSNNAGGVSAAAQLGQDITVCNGN